MIDDQMDYINDLRRALADSQAREAVLRGTVQMMLREMHDMARGDGVSEMEAALFSTESAAVAFVADVRAEARREALEEAAVLFRDEAEEGLGDMMFHEFCQWVEARIRSLKDGNFIYGNVCRSDGTEGLKVK